MKTFAYVFSRTKNHDYRVLSDLSDAVCPAEIRNVFEDRVVGLARDEDEKNAFQWMFIKEGNLALWGVACMNEALDEAYARDKFSRASRGFIGFVLQNYAGEPLVKDINVFKGIFRKVMAPIFDSYIQEQLTDIPVDVNGAASYIYSRPFDSSLNTDYHYCRLFEPGVDAESLVASCMSYPGNISIAFNVAKQDFVTDVEFNPLLNAVMRESMSFATTDVPVKHKCKVCRKKVADLHDDLCQDCWEKLHPRVVVPSPIGLSDNESDESEVVSKEEVVYCPECGNETSSLSAKGLCQECEKRRLLRKRLIWGSIIFVLVSAAVLTAFSFKPTILEHFRNINIIKR